MSHKWTSFAKEGSPRYVKGDTWDLDRVELVIDIKASVSGQLTGRQKARLLALTNDGEKLATCRPHRLPRDNKEWVWNQDWLLNWRFYSLLGLSVKAAGDAAQLVLEEVRSDLDEVSAFAVRHVMPRLMHIWGPERNQTWYELNSSNLSQKLVDLEHLLEMFKKLADHFVVGDAGNALDVITVGEMYRLMKAYLQEAAPGY